MACVLARTCACAGEVFALTRPATRKQRPESADKKDEPVAQVIAPKALQLGATKALLNPQLCPWGGGGGHFRMQCACVILLTDSLICYHPCFFFLGGGERGLVALFLVKGKWLQVM